MVCVPFRMLFRALAEEDCGGVADLFVERDGAREGGLSGDGEEERKCGSGEGFHTRRYSNRRAMNAATALIDSSLT